MASEFGEFVEYERDRAGRDIGLHFVSQKVDGGEIVEPSLVWFQMKGVQANSFSTEDFDSSEDLSIVLDVPHLRFWYIAPEPTYLVLYIESVNRFFVLNIQKYIRENFGDGILNIDQKTLTVHVRKDSELDSQAFYLIKQQRSIEAWKGRIAEGNDFAHVFFRDAELIRRIDTAENRNVSIKLLLRKYGSKTRSEAYFIEASDEDNDEQETIRSHWQYMMPEDLSIPFPYLEFNPDNDDDEFYWDEDEDYEWPPLELPNGKFVYPDGVFEIVEYKMIVSLNEIGKAWAQTLSVMEDAGFIELDALGVSAVSVAPWHGRDV